MTRAIEGNGATRPFWALPPLDKRHRGTGKTTIPSLDAE
jgi:hypothetical protein